MKETIFIGLAAEIGPGKRRMETILPIGLVGRKIWGNKTHSIIEIDYLSLSPSLTQFFNEELLLIGEFAEKNARFNPKTLKYCLTIPNRFCLPVLSFAG